MVLLCECSCQNGRLWLMCFVFVRAVGKLSTLHSSQGSSISSPSLRAHSFSQELYCLFIGEWHGRSRSGIKASALWFGVLSPHLNVSPRTPELSLTHALGFYVPARVHVCWVHVRELGIADCGGWFVSMERHFNASVEALSFLWRGRKEPKLTFCSLSDLLPFLPWTSHLLSLIKTVLLL